MVQLSLSLCSLLSSISVQVRSSSSPQFLLLGSTGNMFVSSRSAVVPLPFLSQVVFGEVVEGMDIVRKVEGLGSQSGKTQKRITIASCGELDRQYVPHQ